MNLMNKDNLTQRDNNLLSATKPKGSILSINTNTKTFLQTKLKQKQIIKIYIEANKYYIEHSAAYALGLIKTRAIMLEKPKLVEISPSIHDKLKNDNDIDIEYVKIEKKPTLKVYIDNSNYYIDNAAAYALGLLTVESFYFSESEYYYIDKEVLNILNNQYEIEFSTLNLDEEKAKKNSK